MPSSLKRVKKYAEKQQTPSVISIKKEDNRTQLSLGKVVPYDSIKDDQLGGRKSRSKRRPKRHSKRRPKSSRFSFF